MYEMHNVLFMEYKVFVFRPQALFLAHSAEVHLGSLRVHPNERVGSGRATQPVLWPFTVARSHE